MLRAIRIGNDIVDISLADVQKKHLDLRFLKRVFSQQEQDTIQQSFNKTKMLWSIWAAKEAAFKACQKEFPNIIFAHREFFLSNETLTNLQFNQPISGFIGSLIYKNLMFSLKWEWCDTAIHCISVLAPNQKIFQHWENVCIQIGSIQYNVNKNFVESHFSRRELHSIFSLESLYARFQAKQFLFTLGFDTNIEIIRPVNKCFELSHPRLLLNGKILDHEVSMSHDTPRAACAIFLCQ